MGKRLTRKQKILSLFIYYDFLDNEREDARHKVKAFENLMRHKRRYNEFVNKLVKETYLAGIKLSKKVTSKND